VNLTREDDEGGIHLHEPMAHVFLGIGGCDGDKEPLEGWYLDTGASSHMTGRADSFLLLDRAVQGTVRFGDGSIVPIEGRGMVTLRSSSLTCCTFPDSRTTSSCWVNWMKGCTERIQASVLRV
jgi:hypothetical protein